MDKTISRGELDGRATIAAKCIQRYIVVPIGDSLFSQWFIILHSNPQLLVGSI